MEWFRQERRYTQWGRRSTKSPSARGFRAPKVSRSPSTPEGPIESCETFSVYPEGFSPVLSDPDFDYTNGKGTPSLRSRQ